VLSHHVEADGGGQADSFGKARLCIAPAVQALARLGLDMNNKGGRCIVGAPAATRWPAQAVSAVAGSTSCRLIGPIGITVEIACL
jgi:hypothetical protein